MMVAHPTSLSVSYSWKHPHSGFSSHYFIPITSPSTHTRTHTSIFLLDYRFYLALLLCLLKNNVSRNNSVDDDSSMRSSSRKSRRDSKHKRKRNRQRKNSGASAESMDDSPASPSMPRRGSGSLLRDQEPVRSASDKHRSDPFYLNSAPSASVAAGRSTSTALALIGDGINIDGGGYGSEGEGVGREGARKGQRSRTELDKDRERGAGGRVDRNEVRLRALLRNKNKRSGRDA